MSADPFDVQGLVNWRIGFGGVEVAEESRFPAFQPLNKRTLGVPTS